jgi:multiple sugar transport system permease protein
MSAGTVLSILPTIVLFAFAQRFIVQGLTQGAEKG